MTNKKSYTIPPQKSAEDTSNWDDRGFAILRPSTDKNGKPIPSLALMTPSAEDSPFYDEVTDTLNVTKDKKGDNIH